MTDFSLIEIVYTAMLSRELIVPNQRLLVGVSGGTDSLALLHMLTQLRKRLPFDLYAATLDHGLRGEAGAADARFVVETAEAWGVPVTAGYADVSALAQERATGIEAAARAARYDFLASVAREVGAERIAVAHNADDQVETVLLHLLRGSGLGGLVGMRERAPLPSHADVTLIRPLLGISRDDLADYCREQDLEPRHDASNDDVAYARNRLRHEIVPKLREVSPQLDRRLHQLGEIAALESDFADSALHAAVDTHVVRTEGRVSLAKEVFLNLHPALQRRFMVWAVRTFGDDQEVDSRRVNAALDMTLRGKVGARAQFRQGVQLRLDYQTIVVERVSEPLLEDQILLLANAVLPVTIPGVTIVEADWSVEASLMPLEMNGVRLAIPEGATVVLCGRREGDRIALPGLKGHTQKISKWMIDGHVPRRLRDRVPLLVIDDEVAVIWWDGQTTISAKFAVTDSLERAVYFRINTEFVTKSGKAVR